MLPRLKRLPLKPCKEPMLKPIKSAIITAAGPSLEDHIEDIKEQQKNSTLIATDTTAPALLKFGIRPDIIINPHAIPSRMTIGQLKETVLGKVLLELGLFGDGTSFGDFEIKDICKELQKIGYASKGDEILYDGLSGEQIKTSIFIGPAFYQRLKHMVNDKQHSRSIGPMVNLTRQPAEGRSRDGGLRYGEMEKDAMVAHGASKFNKGRLYDASDAFTTHVCKKCGLLAAYNNKEHIHICKTCDNKTDFDKVDLPYACKLLFQELITMNIAPRIIT